MHAFAMTWESCACGVVANLFLVLAFFAVSGFITSETPISQPLLQDNLDKPAPERKSHSGF